MIFKRATRSPAFWTGVFLLVHMVLMFRVVLPEHTTLLARDYNIGLMSFYKGEMPEGFFGGFWRSMPLLGRVGQLPLTWNNFLLALLPVDTYFDWIYGLNLLFASFFLIAFLRAKGVGWLASVTGALVAFWLGSNLTLIHPGHLEKYGVLLFASATLFCLEKTLANRDWVWAVLAGGCTGMMFMHQGDVALFFGLPLGLWFFVELLSRGPRHPAGLAKLILPMAVPLAMLCWDAYRRDMAMHVDNVPVLQGEDRDAKWNFLTQWSFPPGESMNLILPGFSGWYTGHDEAPYHGRTGRDANWDAEGAGLANLKLESVYLGLIPLGLVVLALYAFPGSREMRFWALIALATLLLAFGKYTPIYRVFAQLPLVSNIRNPNKFLQVFQLAMGLLTAWGAQAFLTLEDRPKLFRRFAIGFGVFAGLGALAALMLQPDDAWLLHVFSDTPWETRAEGILRTRQWSFVHASLFAVAGALLFVFRQRFRSRPKSGLVAGMALVFLIAGDGLLLGRHYIQPVHTRFLKQNALADFLEANLGNRRVATLDQRGIYNMLVSDLFHYRRIDTLNILAAPRLEGAYHAYFDEIGNDTVRMWREFGVNYVLMPREAWSQLREGAGFDRIFREVFAYDVNDDIRGGYRLVPATRENAGRHVVLELGLPAERHTLLDEWGEQDGKLRTEFHRHGPDPASGEILEVSRDLNAFYLKLRVDAPEALLRLADRHDARLFAIIEGEDEPRPLQPVDGLFTGLVLPRGEHEVTLSFHATSFSRNLQMVGLALWLLVPAGAGLLRMRNERFRPPDRG
ncbi:MAG: hypothetical protein JJU29_22425 [Verrucomicrobia bacterium]|nr:hypothetical protein [Verrucomicrobiota bacterium]